MKRSLPSLLTLALFYSSAIAQNDCNTAMTVTAGAYFVNIVNGTDPAVPVCAPSNGTATHAEWYSYTPVQDQSTTVTTDLPVNTGRDTRFHVYVGTCGALTCIAGSDDEGSGYLSRATFLATAGTTYLIAFDDFWENNAFEFHVSETPPGQTQVSFTPQSIALNGTAFCVTDMNGDHLDDVVAVSSTNVNLHLQQATGGFLVSNVTTTQADFPASWSLCAGDIDGNGFNDLLYAGGGGVTFMMANASGTAFTERSTSEYVFCQRSNMVDINNDGHLDAFVCHDVDPNVYYINDGSGNLTFYQGGLGDTPDGGNYGSIWTDVDGDHDIDLFIAKCRGGTSAANINQVHINDGNGNFTEMAAIMGLADNVQTWSSAWGDFDNDGDMDVVVGASSNTNGGHRVMRNDNGMFTNVAVGSGFDLFTGTSIEWNTHDYDNDGNLDVMGAGALMLGNGDLTFTQTTINPYNGPTGDLNDDGFLDIQNGNTLHMNNGNSNHYFKVYPVGTVSNRNGIGARVEVITPQGVKIRDIRSGDGFEYMSTMAAHFGMGAQTVISQVNVYWPSGIVNTVYNPTIDTGLEIIEGTNTGVNDRVHAPGFSVFPNPALDRLNVNGATDLYGSPYTIMDVAGKTVVSGALTNAPLNIAELPSGVYMIQVRETKGELLQQQFVKQ